MSRILGLRALRQRCTAVSLVLLLLPSGLPVAQAQLFPTPNGGWAYTYDGSTAASVAGAALDGSWDFSNGSDEWDGTGPGAGNPGGAGVFTSSGTTFLRIQDSGNPNSSAYGIADPSNRKVFFTHDLTANGANAAVLDTGITLSFRARIAVGGTLDDAYPDGGTRGPWPVGGDGGVISNGGKGMVGIRQGNGGMISFDLALPSDTDESGPNGGLVMNQLNGGEVNANVNNGSGGVPNYMPLADPTQWHEFWMVVNKAGQGTHRVRVWMDGNQSAATVFDVTAGSGNEDPFDTFLSLGRPGTGESGAFDLDFVSVKPGLHIPGGTVPGDVNGDGLVDLANDFEPIRLNFLQDVLLREQGDLNFDGIVDFGDFEEFKAAFLAGGGSVADINWSPIPEPAAVGLCSMACLAGLTLRRRSRA